MPEEKKVSCLSWSKCKYYESKACQTCKRNENRPKRSYYIPDEPVAFFYSWQVPYRYRGKQLMGS